MYDSILVPTDGSEHAQRAGAHANQLASAFDATVHVLAVTDVQRMAGPFDVGGVSDEYLDRLDADSDEAIADVESLLAAEHTIHTESQRGDPAEVILKYVTEHDIDLVTMGTHGRTGVNRFVAGSVTETVLRQAPVPVFTVRATERSEVTGGYDEILLSTDGSEAASAAVPDGLALADSFDARVHVVNIVDIAVTGASEVAPAEVLETMREIGEKAVEAVAEQARERGVTVVTEVREEFPARGLLNYAEAEDIDMFAMGTTGQSGLSRFLLGSTTERIVRHADVPVVAVNAREDEVS